ncbi:MAG TPA: branched-chain amino acid ABC transporter permease [Solirubrobacterales bacterium]|nr:branched-chain amino acid ABC transporter permease [Solirubrobacterales bacterium]
MGGTDVLNIVIAAIFAIEVALGLTIIFGVMRVINMAHGEFFMLGAYTMVVVTGAGLNPWLGIALAPVLLGMFGILTERTMIRPLYQRADLSSLLATFGLSIVLQQSARLVFGPQSRSVPTPLEGNLNILGTTYPAYRLLAAAIALAVIVAVGALVYRSTFGVRMRATMENTEVASALGTNTSRIAGWAFGLGAALAGFAGALMAPFIGVVSSMGLEQTVQSFLVVITGGMGSIAGTVGGGVMIGGGESALTVPFSGTVAQIAVLLVAITVMLARPQGLFRRGGARSS